MAAAVCDLIFDPSLLLFSHQVSVAAEVVVAYLDAQLSGYDGIPALLRRPLGLRPVFAGAALMLVKFNGSYA